MSDDIYRFVDIYELYELIVNNKLNMLRLALMNDKNEGLGDILKLQESMMFNWALNNQEDIIELHETVKGKTYISSWTSEADLMAMWLLYSENSDVIRIKTTREKLNEVLNKYWGIHYWTNHINSKEGTLQLDSPAVVDDVVYVSFENLSISIKEKHKVFYDKPEFSTNFEITSMQEKMLEEKVIDTRYGSLLKDEAFSHEKEVRAFFSVCLRNNVGQDELVKTKGATADLFGLATHHHPHYSKLPDILKLPTENNFIESLCFDPRMPKYKREMMMKILSPYLKGLKIEESNAFGYKPEGFSFVVD